jgi:anti-sigma factor RsiW
MTDVWTDKLSDYVDGELPENERAALEVHLGGCPTCTETVAELRAVAAEARGLENPPPAHDLWPGIAAAIGAESRVTVMRPRWRSEVRLAFPQLLAAAFALMLLSGGAVWWVLQRASAPTPVTRQEAGRGPIARGPVDTETTAPGLRPAVTPEADEARFAPYGSTARFASSASPRYDATIAELQKVLSDGRGTLDSSTVRILEQNLAIIDQAVEQARRAVAADPANPYLRSHLAATMKRKADLLRKATVLASEG